MTTQQEVQKKEVQVPIETKLADLAKANKIREMLREAGEYELSSYKVAPSPWFYHAFVYGYLLVGDVTEARNVILRMPKGPSTDAAAHDLLQLVKCLYNKEHANALSCLAVLRFDPFVSMLREQIIAQVVQLNADLYVDATTASVAKELSVQAGEVKNIAERLHIKVDADGKLHSAPANVAAPKPSNNWGQAPMDEITECALLLNHKNAM